MLHFSFEPNHVVGERETNLGLFDYRQAVEHNVVILVEISTIHSCHTEHRFFDTAICVTR